MSLTPRSHRCCDCSNALVLAARIEVHLHRSFWGKLFMLLCSLSSPVDTALDIRMFFALVTIQEYTFAILILIFLFLSLRLQLFLFLATTARPLIETLERERILRCGIQVKKYLARCLGWSSVSNFSVVTVAIAWLPLGLQILQHKRCLTSFALEIVYAPLVIVFGPLIIIYGSIVGASSVFSESHFYSTSGKEQVRRIRAIVISAVCTSFQALPQLVIQSVVYAAGTIQLSPHQTQIVIASMTFSVLSLARTALTILSSYRKIVFTLKRINRHLDDTVFNAILHEISEIAKDGDSIHMRWDDDIMETLNSSSVAGTSALRPVPSLQNLRELSLAPADPSNPNNACFRVPPSSSPLAEQKNQADTTLAAFSTSEGRKDDDSTSDMKTKPIVRRRSSGASSNDHDDEFAVDDTLEL
mmetsp:Transcript_14107/g.17573  ORF Transcript_14107/g.17573 Transcript_14107/m.17573 type:complete len:415 (+) Transcript_14107:2-1246(+)